MLELYFFWVKRAVMGFLLGCDVFFLGSGGWGGANCLNEFGTLRVEEGRVEMVPIRF